MAQAERLFEMQEERPLCRCHRLPMTSNGVQQRDGKKAWQCKVRLAARDRRRIRISVAGVQVHVGTMPTDEAADEVRQLIKEEAPSARRTRTA